MCLTKCHFSFRTHKILISENGLEHILKNSAIDVIFYIFWLIWLRDYFILKLERKIMDDFGDGSVNTLDEFSNVYSFSVYHIILWENGQKYKN